MEPASDKAEAERKPILILVFLAGFCNDACLLLIAGSGAALQMVMIECILTLPLFEA